MTCFIRRVLLFAFSIAASLCAEIEVASTFGRIKGLRTTVTGGNNVVYQFRKIPFAVPPTGKLRFQKPIAHGSLTGVYDATEYGPSCMQTINPAQQILKLPNSNVSEDCLHLNIYVPNNLGTPLRAVMLFIHGGGFLIGQGTAYDGSILASSGDVIVVTTNYRLGLLGFLSTEDHMYPGNYGLFDQLEAIKWTKSHIQSFGGDPNKITVFGESAGAFSTALLAVSPLSTGLFQRVILESGGDYQNRIVHRNARKTAFSFFQKLGCTNNTNTNAPIGNDIVQCLISRDSDQILTANDLVFPSILDFIPTFYDSIGPTLDGELLPGVPELLLRNVSSPSSDMFKSLDLLLGYNSAEGGGFILFIIDTVKGSTNISFNAGMSNDFFCNTLIPSQTDQFYHGDMAIQRAMCQTYTPTTDSNVEQGRSAVNWLGDMLFSYPMTQILNFHTKLSSKSSYQYVFTKQPSYRWSPLPSWFRGADHGEEMPCVFGLKDIVSTYTQSEERLSKHMMRYWTNFAKTGNPNSRNGVDPYWPPYKSRKACLELNDRLIVRHDVYSKRLNLWLKTIPNLLSSQGRTPQPFG